MNARNTIHALKYEATVAEEMAQKLRDLFAADEDLVSDMIEGETQLHELIAIAVMRAVELGAMQESIKEMVAKLRSRAERLANQERGLRDALLLAMVKGSVKKLELPVATVSVANAQRRLAIIDESLIPDAFWKQPPRELMKRDLANALKDHPVPGAALDNGGEQLMIRTA